MSSMNWKHKLEILNTLLGVKLFSKRTPLIVGWSLTNRCVYKCKYCNYWNVSKKEISTKEAFNIIEQMADMGTRLVRLSGGEPILREDIGKIIEYCKRKGLFVGMSSSGYGVKEKITCLQGLDMLNLSLDGPEYIHDQIRTKGAYKTVIEAVQAARDKGVKFAFNSVINRLNINSLLFLLDKVNQFESKIYFFPAARQVLGGKDKNELAINDIALYRTFISKLIEEKKKHNKCIGNSYSALRHLYHWPGPHKIPCVAGLIYCRIESDGEIYLCPRAKQQKDDKNCLRDGLKSFRQIPLVSCDDCWCLPMIESSLILSLRFDAILNALSLFS